MFLMILGAVILFDVVATLRGGAFDTLGLGATILGAGGTSCVCSPAKMTVLLSLECPNVFNFFRGCRGHCGTECLNEFCCHQNGEIMLIQYRVLAVGRI
jgi:hypothetical protein